MLRWLVRRAKNERGARPGITAGESERCRKRACPFCRTKFIGTVKHSSRRYVFTEMHRETNGCSRQRHCAGRCSDSAAAVGAAAFAVTPDYRIALPPTCPLDSQRPHARKVEISLGVRQTPQLPSVLCYWIATNTGRARCVRAFALRAAPPSFLPFYGTR